jgi:hypothetical protein
VSIACKSRICTGCGKTHADRWADKLTQTLFSVSHRHIVFTIQEELRAVLDGDHKLLKVLMDAVSQTMKCMIKDRRRALLGIVCVLHPYDRDLELNPHVHALATEGGLTKRDELIPVNLPRIRIATTHMAA